MEITGKNMIGSSLSALGDSFEGVGGKAEWLRVPFHEASEAEIVLACSKSRSAFLLYRDYAVEMKCAFLDTIASKLDGHRDEIIGLATAETFLGESRLQGELTRTINQIKLFSSLLSEGSWVNAIIDTANPDRKPLAKPDIRQMQLPLGPVAVFGASNFPLAFSVAGGDTVSAFAAGCPVVYKAHPGHPATSEAVGRIIVDSAVETGMPDGVFSLLQGVNYSVSTSIVLNDQIEAVAFTGSFSGGKALFDACSRRVKPIPVYAEMGSINPVFVLPLVQQVKTGELAKLLAASNTLSVGQFCTNPGLVVSLANASTNSFLSEFSSELTTILPGCMLTDKIYRSYNTGVQTLASIPGVERVTAANGTDTENLAVPEMFKTSASVFLANETLSDEVFGPSSLHVIAGNVEELKAIAERMPGQLTVSVWGTAEDFEDHKDLIQILQLKAGRIICNAVPTGVEVTHAMVHGGPYPATTDSRSTSVGTNAIYRFTRPVCFQNYPPSLLPDYLKNENPLHIWRKINGKYSCEAIN